MKSVSQGVILVYAFSHKTVSPPSRATWIESEGRSQAGNDDAGFVQCAFTLSSDMSLG